MKLSKLHYFLQLRLPSASLAFICHDAVMDADRVSGKRIIVHSFYCIILISSHCYYLIDVDILLNINQKLQFVYQRALASLFFQCKMSHFSWSQTKKQICTYLKKYISADIYIFFFFWLFILFFFNSQISIDICLKNPVLFELYLKVLAAKSESFTSPVCQILVTCKWNKEWLI